MTMSASKKRKRRDDATLPLFAALAATEDAEERGGAAAPPPTKNVASTTNRPDNGEGAASPEAAAARAEARRIASVLRKHGVYLRRGSDGHVHTVTCPPAPEDDPYHQPSDSPLLPATRALLLTPGYATSRLVRAEDLVDERAEWWKTKSPRERAHRLALRDAIDWHPAPGGSSSTAYEERYAAALARHLIMLAAEAAAAGTAASIDASAATPREARAHVSWDHAPSESHRRRYSPEAEATLAEAERTCRRITAPRVDTSAAAHEALARREAFRRYYEALPGPPPRDDDAIAGEAHEPPPDGTALDPRAPEYDEARSVRRATEALAALKAGRPEGPERARWQDTTGLWEAWLPTLRRMRGDDATRRATPEATDRAVPRVSSGSAVRSGRHQARLPSGSQGQLDLLQHDAGVGDGGRA